MATTTTTEPQRHEENLRINDVIGPGLTALATKAPLFALAGGVLCLAGVVLSPLTFFQSYLVAFMFWFGVTLGSMAWLMGHHITGGGWGYMMRRPLEAAVRCWPLVFALWVPLAVAMGLSMLDGHEGLYEWADPRIVAEDVVLQTKVGYLNPVGWLVRSLGYFVIWFTLGFFLLKWSRLEDASNNPRVRHNLNLLSAGGLVLFVLTVTFSTIDWVMTLEPHWFSSLWGVIFLVGQGLSTLALMVVLLRVLGRGVPLMQRVETRYFRDVGNLMLAFTLLWAYTNFSQFMIQYSANLAEEATWYRHRTEFGWQYFGTVNSVLHFALPFVFLLMSITKVNLNNLFKLALLLLVARHIDLFYHVVPTFRDAPYQGLPGVGIYPMAFLADIGAPILLGGLWLWFWAVQMKKENAPVVPVFDERLAGYWPLPESHAPTSNGHATHGHGGHAHGGHGHGGSETVSLEPGQSVVVRPGESTEVKNHG